MKALPHPVVGLTLATKFYKGNMLSHLANQGTRLSASSFIKSKEPKVVTSAI